MLGFTDYIDERAGLLSGGTRQKLNVTLALMHDPQVLLLDEPYQGFDWETYLRFWDSRPGCASEGVRSWWSPTSPTTPSGWTHCGAWTVAVCGHRRGEPHEGADGAARHGHAVHAGRALP